LTLALCVTFTHPVPAATETITPAAPSFLSAAALAVPERLGTITRVHEAKPGAPWILLIQDAHCVRDAQESIQGLISHVQKEYGVPLVGLEGGEGALDPTLLRAFPDARLKKKALQTYMADGELSGAEYASVFSGTSGFHGVEDWKLYKENFAAYAAARQAAASAETAVNSARQELDRERLEVYSGKHNEFHARLETFREGTDLAEQITYLTETSENHGIDLSAPGYGHLNALASYQKSRGEEEQNRIDVALRQMASQFEAKHAHALAEEARSRFSAARQDYLSGKTEGADFLSVMMETGVEAGLKLRLPDYLAEVLTYHAMLQGGKGAMIFAEADALSSRIEGLLSSGAREKEMSAEYKRLRLLGDMVRLEATRESFTNYAAAPEAYLKLLGGSDQNLAPALLFYAAALRRDEAILGRIARLLKKNRAESAVIVSGGFHSGGLAELFRREGFSFAVITPSIGSLSGHDRYDGVMDGNVSYTKDWANPYDSFMKHAGRRLVAGLSEPDYRKTLKYWRDELIRLLAREKRIHEVGKYAPYIDALFDDYGRKFGGETSAEEAPSGEFEKVFEAYAAKRGRELWASFESALDGMVRNMKKIAPGSPLGEDNFLKLLGGTAGPEASLLSAEISKMIQGHGSVHAGGAAPALDIAASLSTYAGALNQIAAAPLDLASDRRIDEWARQIEALDEASRSPELGEPDPSLVRNQLFAAINRSDLKERYTAREIAAAILTRLGREPAGRDHHFISGAIDEAGNEFGTSEQFGTGRSELRPNSNEFGTSKQFGTGRSELRPNSNEFGTSKQFGTGRSELRGPKDLSAYDMPEEWKTIASYARSEGLTEVRLEDLERRGYMMKTPWGAPLTVVQHHHHVVAAWREAHARGVIDKGAKLYHIDAHEDDGIHAKSVLGLVPLPQEGGRAGLSEEDIRRYDEEVRARTGFNYGIATFIFAEMLSGLLDPRKYFFDSSGFYSENTLVSPRLLALNTDAGKRQSGFPGGLFKIEASSIDTPFAEEFPGEIDIVDFDIDVYARSAEGQMSNFTGIALELMQGAVKDIQLEDIREDDILQKIVQGFLQKKSEESVASVPEESSIRAFIRDYLEIVREGHTVDYERSEILKEHFTGAAAEATLRRLLPGLVTVLRRAKVITIATSPEYIHQGVAAALVNQVLTALQVFHDSGQALEPVGTEGTAAEEAREMPSFKDEDTAGLLTNEAVPSVTYEMAAAIAGSLYTDEELKQALDESSDHDNHGIFVDYLQRTNPRMLIYAKLLMAFIEGRPGTDPILAEKGKLGIAALFSLLKGSAELPVEEGNLLKSSIPGILKNSYKISAPAWITEGAVQLERFRSELRTGVEGIPAAERTKLKERIRSPFEKDRDAGLRNRDYIASERDGFLVIRNPGKELDRWPQLQTPLSFVNKAFRNVLGQDFGKLVLQRIENLKAGESLVIVDWGVGNAAALREIARSIPEAKRAQVRLVGFGDIYLDSWLEGLELGIEFIFDRAENFRNYFSEGEIDILYSNLGLNHLNKENSDTARIAAALGVDPQGPIVLAAYLNSLAPLLRLDGMIVSTAFSKGKKFSDVETALRPLYETSVFYPKLSRAGPLGDGMTNAVLLKPRTAARNEEGLPGTTLIVPAIRIRETLDKRVMTLDQQDVPGDGFGFDEVEISLDQDLLLTGILDDEDPLWREGERSWEMSLSGIVDETLKNARMADDDEPMPGVRISLRARELEGGVEIRISDTGEGIPEKILSEKLDGWKPGNILTTHPAGRDHGSGLKHIFEHARRIGAGVFIETRRRTPEGVVRSSLKLEPGARVQTEPAESGVNTGTTLTFYIPFNPQTERVLTQPGRSVTDGSQEAGQRSELRTQDGLRPDFNKSGTSEQLGTGRSELRPEEVRGPRISSGVFSDIQLSNRNDILNSVYTISFTAERDGLTYYLKTGRADIIDREILLMRQLETIPEIKPYLPELVTIHRADDNDARLLAEGVQSGWKYFITAAAPGKDYLDPASSFGTYGAAGRMKLLADALETFHKNGLAHGDLKPQEVIADLAREKITLVDYGLATLEGTESLGAASLAAISIKTKSISFLGNDDSGNFLNRYARDLRSFIRILQRVSGLSGSNRQFKALFAARGIDFEDILTQLDANKRRTTGDASEDGKDLDRLYTEYFPLVVAAVRDIFEQVRSRAPSRPDGGEKLPEPELLSTKMAEEVKDPEWLSSAVVRGTGRHLAVRIDAGNVLRGKGSLFAVLNGIGSSRVIDDKATHLVSRVQETLAESFERNLLDSAGNVQDAIEHSMRELNSWLWDLSQEEPAYGGQGGTLALVYVPDKWPMIYMAFIGNSPLVLLSGGEKVYETLGHVNAAGEPLRTIGNFTEKGNRFDAPGVNEFRLQPGMVVFLGTEGFTGPSGSLDFLREELLKGTSGAPLAEAVQKKRAEAGMGKDDMTGIRLHTNKDGIIVELTPEEVLLASDKLTGFVDEPPAEESRSELRVPAELISGPRISETAFTDLKIHKRGSMSITHKAVKEGKNFFVKTGNASYDVGHKLVVREAVLLSRLRKNPSLAPYLAEIVSIQNTNREDSAALQSQGAGSYFIMEAAPGTSYFVPVEGAEKELVVMHYTHLLADALAAFHGQGVAHGDLKPNEVFADRASEKVTILDFGVAVMRGIPEFDPDSLKEIPVQGPYRASSVANDYGGEFTNRFVRDFRSLLKIYQRLASSGADTQLLGSLYRKRGIEIANMTAHLDEAAGKLKLARPVENAAALELFYNMNFADFVEATRLVYEELLALRRAGEAPASEALSEMLPASNDSAAGENSGPGRYGASDTEISTDISDKEDGVPPVLSVLPRITNEERGPRVSSGEFTEITQQKFTEFKEVIYSITYSAVREGGGYFIKTGDTRFLDREVEVMRELEKRPGIKNYLPELVSIHDADEKDAALLERGMQPGWKYFITASAGKSSFVNPDPSYPGSYGAAKRLLLLADALDAFHRNGITHGDLKPQEIYADLNNNAIKIIDFGLASVDGIPGIDAESLSTITVGSTTAREGLGNDFSGLFTNRYARDLRSLLMIARRVTTMSGSHKLYRELFAERGINLEELTKKLDGYFVSTEAGVVENNGEIDRFYAENFTRLVTAIREIESEIKKRKAPRGDGSEIKNAEGVLPETGLYEDSAKAKKPELPAWVSNEQLRSKQDRYVAVRIQADGVQNGTGNLFAVLDGHGPDQIINDNVTHLVNNISKALPDFFAKALAETKGNVEDAIDLTVERLNLLADSLVNDEPNYAVQGTTLTLFYVPDFSTLGYLGIVGDSPFAVIENGKAVKLVFGHRIAGTHVVTRNIAGLSAYKKVPDRPDTHPIKISPRAIYALFSDGFLGPGDELNYALEDVLAGLTGKPLGDSVAAKRAGTSEGLDDMTSLVLHADENGVIIELTPEEVRQLGVPSDTTLTEKRSELRTATGGPVRESLRAGADEAGTETLPAYLAAGGIDLGALARGLTEEWRSSGDIERIAAAVLEAGGEARPQVEKSLRAALDKLMPGVFARLAFFTSEREARAWLESPDFKIFLEETADAFGIPSDINLLIAPSRLAAALITPQAADTSAPRPQEAADAVLDRVLELPDFTDVLNEAFKEKAADPAFREWFGANIKGDLTASLFPGTGTASSTPGFLIDLKVIQHTGDSELEQFKTELDVLARRTNVGILIDKNWPGSQRFRRVTSAFAGMSYEGSYDFARIAAHFGRVFDAAQSFSVLESDADKPLVNARAVQGRIVLSHSSAVAGTGLAAGAFIRLMETVSRSALLWDLLGKTGGLDNARVAGVNELSALAGFLNQLLQTDAVRRAVASAA